MHFQLSLPFNDASRNLPARYEEEPYEDFLREMRRASPGPIIMPPASGSHIAEEYPAVAAWVQGYGHIEIGDQEGFGFVVRALDYGGLVFENDRAGTLVEAMAVLEKGLRKWFAEQGIDLE